MKIILYHYLLKLGINALRSPIMEVHAVNNLLCHFMDVLNYNMDSHSQSASCANSKENIWIYPLVSGYGRQQFSYGSVTYYVYCKSLDC